MAIEWYQLVGPAIFVVILCGGLLMRMCKRNASNQNPAMNNTAPNSAIVVGQPVSPQHVQPVNDPTSFAIPYGPPAGAEQRYTENDCCHDNNNYPVQSHYSV